jgi:hypothetical protein
MEQEATRWIPLAIALGAVMVVLFRNIQLTKERRSSGQLLIFALYRAMRIVWAVLRGIDVGYLEYRRVLQETPIEVENERRLGKLVKGRGDDKAAIYGWQ